MAGETIRARERRRKGDMGRPNSGTPTHTKGSGLAELINSFDGCDDGASEADGDDADQAGDAQG